MPILFFKIRPAAELAGEKIAKNWSGFGEVIRATIQWHLS